MKKRKFYAKWCSFGANAVHANDIRISWADFYAFDSKAARDTWIDKHYYHRANVAAAVATRAEVIQNRGADFVLRKPPLDGSLEFGEASDADYICVNRYGDSSHIF